MSSDDRFGRKHRYTSTDRFLFMAGKVLQQNGWKIEVEPRLNDIRPDFLLEKEGFRYAVELKSVGDGKRARILPQLSMAILQALAASKADAGLRPLAVIMAPRIEDSVAEQLREFAFSHAPNVALGVIDFEGLRRFWGQGLEDLNSAHLPEMRERSNISEDQTAYLFSDLNQWLLKVLVGQRLPQELMHVPRGKFQNASQLADAAGVSVMSAFRFLRQLENEGFLKSTTNWLQIGNIERLLSRWQAAMLRPQKENSYRWIIRGGSDEKMLESIRAYQMSAVQRYGNRAADDQGLYPPIPRLCVGGFMAASQLGFGHVGGVPPLLYAEQINPEIPRLLGLKMIEDNRPADVFIKIPACKESVFRAAVTRDGVQVSDILQIWLESSINPARGAEQARLIEHSVLHPLLQDNS